MKRQIKPQGAQPRRRRILHRCLFCAAGYLIYVLLGMSIPFLIQPDVDTSTQAAFDLARVWGEGSPDRAALVEDNQQALEIRLRMIEEADSRLILTNFDIRDSESGRDIAAALLSAAERGVKVKILTDGMNGLISMATAPMFYVLGEHPNVEVRFYNTPNPLFPWTFHGRMHDKYIIADSRLMLVGGRNTFDKFLGDYVPQHQKSHDLEVLLYNTAWAEQEPQGSVIAQVEDYFQALWNHEHTSIWLESTPVFYKGGVQRERGGLEERYEAMRVAAPVLFDTTRPVDYEALTVPLDGVTLLHNPTNILAKEPWVWWQMQQLMAQAQNRVYLQTPYAVCSEAMYRGLSEIADKDINFTILINSMGVGDNFMASSDYFHNKGKLLETGASFWEWYGSYSSHGKSVLIDQDLSLVGSYNLDMRSTYIDTEMMFVFHGQAFNQLLEDYLFRIQQDSLLATGVDTYQTKPDLQPWDNGDWKHKLYPVTSILLQPFRFLL